MDSRELEDQVIAVLHREQSQQTSAVNSTGFSTGVTALLWLLGVLLSGGGVYMMQQLATESRLVKLEEQASLSESLPKLIDKFGSQIERDTEDRKRCMDFLVKKNSDMELEITQLKYEVNMIIQSQHRVNNTPDTKR
jgi:hypothetical protein